MTSYNGLPNSLPIGGNSYALAYEHVYSQVLIMFKLQGVLTPPLPTTGADRHSKGRCGVEYGHDHVTGWQQHLSSII
ncbi:Uncharacterized protein PBTT_01412 [Plasmodiophora brassicae]